MDAVLILRLALLALTAIFLFYFVGDCLKHKEDFKSGKTVPLILIGFITDFFDTLGIGCFATTQTGFKFTKTCDDELMPGTLNVSHTLPIIAEALLFLGLVEMDTFTLISMIGVAVLGAVIGAGIVSKWAVKVVRIALGCALTTVACIMIAQLLEIGIFAGSSGDALALTGGKLVIGLVINFLLGALMTIGVGLYAPCMALVGALGMNVGAAFPIMMGSCAFLMPAASVKFIKEGKYDRKAAAVVNIAGVLGVLVAYFLVKSLPLETLKWVVITVMFYTAITFFKDALTKQAE